MEVYKREINNKERGEPTVVIAADTIIVSHAGRILEKPRGEQDHIKMLTMLRDDVEHKVMTAVVVMHPLESCVQPGYKIATHVEETTVKFDPTGMYCIYTFQGRKNLTTTSSGRDDTRLYQDARWKRQSGRLWHTKWRVNSDRTNRRHIRQCCWAAAAPTHEADRQGHGA
jgi:hypothetical protein